MDVPSKKVHCCEVMQGILERGASALRYLPSVRMYIIYEVIEQQKCLRYGGCNAINYCPWCSSALPSSLHDTMESVLINELRLEDPWAPENEHLIPQEFKTDEWWKKRGL